MKIAVEGCAHGELEKIYDTLVYLEEENNIKIDLLICCGDFQSTRNLQDLQCMAIPPKYYDICTFYKYYTGELRAPFLTIFIGGNHEASNYLQELSYGGWVAPHIYYMGYANVINVAGIRIGGISGIFKGFDYLKGHFEKSPYNENTKRSVYHIRNLEIYRLKQISSKIDIFISHDWPKGIHSFGNCKKLLQKKPFFKDDIDSNKLGSPPCEDLLRHLKPSYWFAAHLHCKFAAVVPHDNSSKEITKFLALDKCLPKRKFLQIVDIPHIKKQKIEMKYDLEWLTILHLTNHLLSVKASIQYMPGPGSEMRWNFTPTDEEKQFVMQRFDNDLTIPLNFTQTVKAYNPNDSFKTKVCQPPAHTNHQTRIFCEKLSIDDPLMLIMSLSDNQSIDTSKSYVDNSTNFKLSDFTSTSLSNEFNLTSKLVELNKLNSSMPDCNINTMEFSQTNKLSLTLPAPKFNTEDYTLAPLDNSIKDKSNPDSSQDISFSDIDVHTSTPQTKKFKRRNESIYKSDD